MILTESQLRQIIKESIKETLINEGLFGNLFGRKQQQPRQGAQQQQQAYVSPQRQIENQINQIKQEIAPWGYLPNMPEGAGQYYEITLYLTSNPNYSFTVYHKVIPSLDEDRIRQVLTNQKLGTKCGSINRVNFTTGQHDHYSQFRQNGSYGTPSGPDHSSVYYRG